MGYAVELFLDGPMGLRVKEAVMSICPMLIDIGFYPHITLSVLDAPDIPEIIEATRAYADEAKALKLRLASYGFFPGQEEVLFLAPAPTQDLMATHALLHRILLGHGLASDPRYLPGAWVPHCTLAMGQHFDESMERLVQFGPESLLGECLLAEVHVVKFRPVKRLAEFSLGTI